MTASIKQLLTLVGPAIHQLPTILLAFLTLSTVELFGLGLLIPYVELIFMGDYSSVGNQIMILLGLERTTQDDLLLIFSSLIVMAFVLKFGLTMVMVGVINNFAQKQPCSCYCLSSSIPQRLIVFFLFFKNCANRQRNLT